MDLYSRQIGAFGLDAMLKLVKMKVLLVGLRGVGIEAAKNLALAGVHTLTLFDPKPIAERDLGSNFFVTRAEVGRARALVCAPKVQELNPNVLVRAADSELHELTEDLVASHDVLIVTSNEYCRRSELVRWNEFCRSRTKVTLDERGTPSSKASPIGFVYCATGGVVGTVFVDFGPNFIVRDATGREPLVKLVERIEPMVERNELDGSETHYTLVRYITPDGQTPGSIADGTLIQFSDVSGLESPSNADVSLNTSGPWRTWSKPSDPHGSLRIGDTRAFSTPYRGNGVLTEVREPQVVPFRSLAECLLRPSTAPYSIYSENLVSAHGFPMVDMLEFGIEAQLHVAHAALLEFYEKHGRLPRVYDADDTREAVALAQEFNDMQRLSNRFSSNADGRFRALAVDEVRADVVERVASTATVELQPLCAFLGGIVAQEVVKMSGRFTPLTQWLHYHAFQALPAERPTDATEVSPANEPELARYADQIAIFGREFQRRLCNLRLFMVGCGALGCEFIKNFALMGIACGDSGLLTVTDPDRIEVSNLNRQFLFREENVGQSKAASARARALAMNPSFRIEPRQDYCAVETEHIFNDEFWNSQDVICNALDSMKARFYVDNRCVFYERPLLESGTMGTGANVDVVLPHKTKTYTEGGQADEGGGIPMCTLRNFPHLIDHCIEWARAQFDDLFVSPARQAATFLADPAAFLAKQRADTFEQDNVGLRRSAISKAIPRLRLLRATLESATEQNRSLERCVSLAHEVFYRLFRDRIIDLTTKFPADHTTKDGKPFWTGHHRFPTTLRLSFDDAASAGFVIAAANLFASMLKIHPPKHSSEKNDPDHRWLEQYRSTEWLSGLLANVPEPEYIAGRVADLDEESEQATSSNSALSDEEQDAAEEATLRQVLADLEALAGSVPHDQFEPADFEKDDDDNFHIVCIWHERESQRERERERERDSFACVS